MFYEWYKRSVRSLTNLCACTCTCAFMHTLNCVQYICATDTELKDTVWTRKLKTFFSLLLMQRKKTIQNLFFPNATSIKLVLSHGFIVTLSISVLRWIPSAWSFCLFDSSWHKASSWSKLSGCPREGHNWFLCTTFK